jgi:sugar lactone lactonase YvrE
MVKQIVSTKNLIHSFSCSNHAVAALALSIGFVILAGCGLSPSKGMPTTTAGRPDVGVILSGLDNPRGVAVGPAGALFVAEAGTGYAAVDPTQMTGKLTKFTDRNGDGDFDDEGEAERWFSHFPTYNAEHFTNSVRDEVGGPSDLLLHRDGRVYLSIDGGFDEQALVEISPEGRVGRTLADRSNMNGIAFDPDQERVYAVESSFNLLIEVTFDGQLRRIAAFPPLDSGQQAVPAGLTVDSQTGEILVALFSGAVVDDETGDIILFVPGDAKVVRVNPETGRFTDEITGLTTAVDVAMDSAGNIFVVEMASAFVDPFPRGFDFFDLDAPPLHGGYKRYSGRVTLYPADGRPPRVLADGLDTPSNITLAPDGALFVSTGQGTPGRPIPGPDGPTTIIGEIVRITNFLSETEHQRPGGD